MAEETIQRVTPALESLGNAISTQTKAFSSFIQTQVQLKNERRRQTQLENLRREEDRGRESEDAREKSGMITRLNEIFDKLQQLVPTSGLVEKAALLPIIGFFAGNFVKGFVTAVLENVGVDDPETRDMIASSVNTAIQWGAIGSAIGLILKGSISGSLKGGAIVGLGFGIATLVENGITNAFDSLEIDNPELEESLATYSKRSIEWGSIGMLFGPKIGALFAAGGLIYTFFERNFSDISNWFEEKSKEIMEFDLSGFVSDTYNSATKWFKDTYKWTEEGISTGIDTISSIASGTYESAMSWFSNTYKWAEDGISTGIDTISSIVSGAYNSAMGWFDKNYKWTKEGISTGIDSITSIASGAYESAMSWFSNTYKWAEDGISTGIDSITSIASDAYNSAMGWFDKNYKWTKEGISTGIDTISSIASGAYNSAINWFKDSYKWAEDGISTGIDTISSIASGAYESAMSWFKDSYKWAEDGISTGIDTISSIASSAYNSAMGWFGNTYKWAEDGISTGIDTISSIASSAYNSAMGWFDKNYKWTEDDISTENNSILSVATNTYKSAMSWFGNTYKWTEDGISTENDNVTSIASSAYESAIKWFRDSYKWTKDNLQSFSLMEMIEKSIDDIIRYFTDFLPTFDDISKMAGNLVRGTPLEFLLGNENSQPEDNSSELEIKSGNESSVIGETLDTFTEKLGFISDATSSLLGLGGNASASGANIVDGSVRVGGSPSINNSTTHNHYSVNPEAGLSRTIGIGF